MSDLPPGMHTPCRADSLARTLFSLLPGQAAATDEPQLSPPTAQGPAAASGAVRVVQPGQQTARGDSGGGATPPPTPRSRALTPTPAAAVAASSSMASRMACLLGRLLEAAGTSGSSIAELAAAGSGTLAPSGHSGCSRDSSYSCLPGGSSADLFGSACSAAAPEDE